jgi:hypothetical protein
VCVCIHTNNVSVSKNEEPCINIYINMDGNPSIKCTRHVKANVNTWKENQDHQNNNNKFRHVSVNDLHLHMIYMWYIWLLTFTHTKLVSSHHCHNYYKFIKQFTCLCSQFFSF